MIKFARENSIIRLEQYMKKFISFIIIISLLSPSALALEDIKIEKGAMLNLNDCINISLSNSPLVKRTIYNLRTAKNNISIAKSAYTPTVSAGVGYNQTFNSMSGNGYTMQTNRNTRTFPSVSASINQMLFNFGKTLASVKMQKYNKIAAEYEFDYSVLTTTFDVKLKYYAVLAAKSVMDIERSNVQITERNYIRTQAYFDEGIRSRIDLVNAEVNLSDAKVALVQAENNYKNALVALNNSMYVAYAPEYEITNTETFNLPNPYVPVSLTRIANDRDLSEVPEAVQDAVLTSSVEKSRVLEDYKFQKYPFTFEESVDLAMKNRPDLKALSSTVKAMEQSLLFVKRQYFPTLSANVGYGLANTQRYTNNSMSISVNLSTSFNIFQLQKEIDNAKIQVESAKNEVKLLSENLYFDVQGAYIDMIQLEKQIPLLETKVRQTLENLELADGRYEVGLGDYIQLQDARVNYNNAQNTYVQTIYKYNVARATLEQAIALNEDVKLTVKDLKL
ncbi:MAG: TolC family protein [Fusobacterium sp.]|nr:TolC family protein [Fusobacterium sp.]